MLTDLLIAPPFPRDLNVIRAELTTRHRVLERRFMLRLIPEGSVGAELGVFTGLFSALIAANPRVSRATFIDPWWQLFGDTYPNWGAYSDFGRLTTRGAYEAAKQRIARSALPHRIVEVGSSYDWLEAQPDESLDWVYLDSTHTYEGTKRELMLLDRKIKSDGVILGDDWQTDRMNRHHGVFLAVSAFLKATDFEMVFCGRANQWALRRRLPDTSALPFLREDRIHSLPNA